MNFAVEHIALPSCNPVRLRDWYVTKLGAECIAPDGDGRPFFLRLPGARTLFEVYPAATSNAATADNGTSGWRHLALRVDSIESTRKELESRGVVFTDPIKPAAAGGRVLFFQDCDGNLLHLVDRPKDSILA
jgi:glyoxylase I family protein